MDLTILICLVVLYVIVGWIIGFNVLHDERFNILDKRVVIGCLLIPPIGVLLFFLIRQNRKKEPRKKKRILKRPVYHGSYDGGHNKPKR